MKYPIMTKQEIHGELELPKVTYKVQDYTKEDLDKIFKKLLKYENDYSEKLVEIRKEQILKHSKSYFISDTLNDLAKLIGQAQDQYTELMMQHLQENLIQLHSPVIFNVPINLEPFHKWETWSISELYEKYWDLAIGKGWEDYYGYNDLSLKNIFDNVKNYHVVDMLTDLVVNDCLICGFGIMSFMNCDDDNRLLEPFNHHYSDKIIEVKLKEKFASMKEYHDSIFNSFKKEGK